MKTAAEWAKWMSENPMQIGPHAGTTDAYEEACQRAFEGRIAMVQEDARADFATPDSSADRERSRELELESARRVSAGCWHKGHGPGTHGPGACPSCIASYAQQLRADRRAMRKALEWEQAESARLRAQIKALFESLSDSQSLLLLIGGGDAAEMIDAQVAENRAALRLAEGK